MFKRYFLLFILLFNIAIFTGCTNESPAPVPETIEHQMAFIDKGTSYSQNDPAIREYRDLLNRITPKSNDSEEKIGDMIAASRNILKEKGIQVSYMDMLVGINNALSVREDKRDLSLMLSTYCSFRIKGNSHTESMAMIRGMNKTWIFDPKQ